MFRDNSLVPAEAIRLAALGFLAETPRRYGALAIEVRHFTSRVAGPSPELMGTSLELLRYEGLVDATAKGMPDDPELSLAPAGREALNTLLRATVRAPGNDLAKLNLFLKLRFLHHLPVEEQAEQIGQVAAACESELARLEDLQTRQATVPGMFADWVAHDIQQIKARIAWLQARRAAATA